jgi:hypothetical protein
MRCKWTGQHQSIIFRGGAQYIHANGIVIAFCRKITKIVIQLSGNRYNAAIIYIMNGYIVGMIFSIF